MIWLWAGLNGREILVQVAMSEAASMVGGKREHPKAGRPEAALAIWSWRHDEREPEEEASPARARLRGLIQALAGLTIGGIVFLFVSQAVSYFIFSLAALVFLAAVISPLGLFAGIERAFAAFGRVVGRLLAGLLLPMIFYGIFLPFGLLFRRGSRDSMKRFYEIDAPSYWTHREPRTADSYRRQF